MSAPDQGPGRASWRSRGLREEWGGCTEGRGHLPLQLWP